MSEAIKALTKTTASGIGGEGSLYMEKSYTDIIYPPKEPRVTADDIIDGIKQKLREYE